MRRLLIATAAATALLAGAGAASAQTFQSDGPDYYSYRSPGIGVQVGPLGAGIYADAPEWGYSRPYGYRSPDNSTENMRAFHSQEVWPQSPPGGS